MDSELNPPPRPSTGALILAIAIGAWIGLFVQTCI